MINELRKANNISGTDCNQFNLEFAWRDEGKPIKSSVRADILT
jgi:hypothetical protein